MSVQKMTKIMLIFSTFLLSASLIFPTMATAQQATSNFVPDTQSPQPAQTPLTQQHGGLQTQNSQDLLTSNSKIIIPNGQPATQTSQQQNTDEGLNWLIWFVGFAVSIAVISLISLYILYRSHSRTEYLPTNDQPKFSGYGDKQANETQNSDQAATGTVPTKRNLKTKKAKRAKRKRKQR
ncbi:MAG: hypothetical protein U5K77_02180 [Candidatus Saccharibacteria bacterium]|nr:hypothetical protein [Candidatus Saccharibacteria bacterium]